MSEKAITVVEPQSAAAIVERVITVGDLSKLSPTERVAYYARTCESLGLNPLTRPFEYITLQGKMVMYARKDAGDQLRRLHGVSVEIVSREIVNDVYVVTARATMPDGRRDEEIGAVPIKGVSGEQLCNAMMKAGTKAKRRVTLSICGLGMLDESEVASIPDSRPSPVDMETGVIVEQPGPTPARKPKTVSEWSAAVLDIARLSGWTDEEAAALIMHELNGLKDEQEQIARLVSVGKAIKSGDLRPPDPWGEEGAPETA